MTVQPPPTAVLVGLRASGKSTVGAELAVALGAAFHDLDDLALERCPETEVATVFESRGEQAWREAETRALETGLAFPGSILALGGGAPAVAAIEERLNEERRSGRVVVFWLDVPDQMLAERIGEHDRDRPPLLRDASQVPLGPLEESRRLRTLRSPCYERVSDHVIDAGGTTSEVVKRILDTGTLASGAET